jgi:hypothetical protein
MTSDVLLPGGEPLLCTSCSRPLGLFVEDQPDWPGGPLCGDCYQARQQEDEIHWGMYESEG